MASTLTFVEDFEGVSNINELLGTSGTVDVTKKWNASAAAVLTQYSLSGGKLRKLSTGDTNFLRAQAWRIYGGNPICREAYWGFKYTTPPAMASGDAIARVAGVMTTDIWRMDQSGTGGVELHVQLMFPSGASFTTVGLGLVASTEYNIEVYTKIVIGAATGIFQVRVNGIQVIGSSTINFDAIAANNFFGDLTLGSSPNSTSRLDAMWDEVWVDLTSFHTEWDIQTKHPNGNGATSDLINSAGNSLNNYTYVDETGINDADYVQGFQNGDKDTYAFEDVTPVAGYSVKGVQQTSRAAAISSGSPLLQHRRRTAGFELASSGLLLPDAQLREVSSVARADGQGNPWTFSNVNGSEYGYNQGLYPGSASLNGSQRWETPDHASLDITGDQDMRMALRSDDWSPSTQRTLFGKWDAAGQRSYLCYMQTPQGNFNSRRSSDGTATTTTNSDIAMPFPDGLGVLFRQTVSISGNIVVWYTKALNFETMLADLASNSDWQRIGAVSGGGAITCFSGTSNLAVGMESTTIPINGFIGDIYAMILMNGIAGTVVANPDFFSNVSPFNDAAGRTWTKV